VVQVFFSPLWLARLRMMTLQSCSLKFADSCGLRGGADVFALVRNAFERLCACHALSLCYSFFFFFEPGVPHC
jgi:hypothetical protein